MTLRSYESRRILHQVNLDTIGGVELLLRDFLSVADETAAQHHLLVHCDPVHPMLLGSLEKSAKSIQYIKYWKRHSGRLVKIPSRPRSLRNWQIRSALKRVKPDAVMCWNIMEPRYQSLKPPSIIYYDLEASWRNPLNPEFKGFLHGADLVIAGSFASKRMLQLKWGVDQPIEVVLNPLRPSAQPKNTTPKTLNQPWMRIGVAARLVPLKGVLLTIHMLRELHNKGRKDQLLIAGTGPELQALQSLARDLSLEGSVRFLGCVDDMRSFYESIDVLVSPSLSDVLCLVGIEALSYGVPVIGPTVDGYSEMIQHNKTGVLIEPTLTLDEYRALGGSVRGVPERVYSPVSDSLRSPAAINPSVLASTIEQLASDPERYQSLSAHAARDILPRFSFETYTEHLQSVLTPVLAR